MSTIHVRPGVPGDETLILAMVRELAEYERAPLAVVATEAMIRESLFGARPACESVIGEVDGRPEGIAVYFHNYSTWLGRRGVYLEDLFVRPGARGKGLGRALLARVAAIAVERGCERVDWMVLDWNEPAWKFYRAIGARALTDWTIHRLDGDALTRLAREAQPG